MYRHADLSAPINSPADFAAQLGYELSRITKTLLIRSIAGDIHALVVSPMGKKIDFPLVARLLGAKRVQVSPPDELQRLTGYPERGVSPLGVHGLKTLIDEELFRFETILIGAGEAGVEIEINPTDLESITNATRAPIARSE